MTLSCARTSLGRVNRAAPMLLLLPLLAGCQDVQARQENAELTRRVAALETQVRTLKAAQTDTALPDDAAAFEAKAAAQNCANALTRALETFRQDSIDRRYPTQAQLEVPDACQGQRVGWLTLRPQEYTFVVSSETGAELARQTGP